MTDYVVTYDLRKETGTEGYKELWDELKRLDGHRTLDSVWLVNVNNTAKELHDHLKAFMDGNDRLWVSELTKKHHYSNARGGTNEWLANNPPDR
ncbi:MAG: hypothetical protein RLO05_05765 [Rhodospirillales bacterium]